VKVHAQQCIPYILAASKWNHRRLLVIVISSTSRVPTRGLPLLSYLLLLSWWEDLYFWLNSDPLGFAVLQVLFILVLGLCARLCMPKVSQKLEEKIALRDEGMPEWDESEK